MSNNLCHQQSAHVSAPGTEHVIGKGVVLSFKNVQFHDSKTCDSCVAGKPQVAPIPRKRTFGHRPNLPSLVHTDIARLMAVLSTGESRYVKMFIEDHSNWVVMYAIKQKSEATECYLDNEKFVEHHKTPWKGNCPCRFRPCGWVYI